MCSRDLAYVKMNTCLVFCLVLLYGTSSVFPQTIEDEFENICTGSTTSCGACIRKSAICSWCASDSFPRAHPRCDVKSNLKRNNCSDADIEDPKSTQSITMNADYTSGSQVNKIDPVQIRPQKLAFKVRPNDKRNFVLSFQQQQNYPVDLYLLLDKTSSIISREEAKTKLIGLGNDLPKAMEDITNNFKMGFGSFVDKNVAPYSAWTKQLLDNRCQSPTGECIPAYLFKNEEKLGVNAGKFAETMRESLEKISLSIDDTEGGLEALIQVLDCNSNIDWRENSRKIVVYSSNSKFHLAGAGKLGGATKQGKMSCGMQSDSDKYNNVINDYPSVSQIAAKLSEKKINVIFAVTQMVKEDYQLLKSYLDEAEVGVLEKNSSNIVDLIKNQYNALRSRVQFKPQDADNVEFQFQSKCRGDVLAKTAKCENLRIGENVDFNVSMTVSPEICKGKNGTVKKVVTIGAVGLNEQVTINLEVICDCECEKPGNEKVDSPVCENGNGTLICGTCKCNDGRYGRNCECDETEMSNEVAKKQCINGNDTDICSDNGECICGVCNCFPIAGNSDQIYSGKFCNCNDYNCPFIRINGVKELCGGTSRGSCKCSKCLCSEDWSGPDCSCTKDETTCKASNNKTCNDLGECKCGKCHCFTNGTKKMTGPTCEDCLDCPSRCTEYEDCAQCKGFGTGRYSIDECEQKCGKTTQLKKDLPSGEGIRECKGSLDKKCDFFFTYTYTADNDVRIVVSDEKKCAEEAPVVAIVGGTVAAVVLIPLLLIILFIFIRNRRDAKEFADFMKEREKAKWDSAANPIYKDPKSTFQNPTYRGVKA